MLTPTPNESSFVNWRLKLSAFLHDSPSKPLDIRAHEQRAEGAMRRAGLVDVDGKLLDFPHSADHTAAAADRLPFPNWSAAKLRSRYDARGNPLRHPLGASEPLRSVRGFATARLAEDGEQMQQPVAVCQLTAASSNEEARIAFFAHWRLWRSFACEQHPGFAVLPADTRIPDHTIWNHMGVVSALAGAGEHPALLRFQLGPVQDFIAAARNTRDLWSASYLLSWLMAKALATLSLEIGPDSVLFPNLWGQPLIDLHLRNDLWDKLRASATAPSAWNSILESHGIASPDQASLGEPFTIPNLPNVFVALVPAGRARELAALAERTIREEWGKIAASVKEQAAKLFETDTSGVPDAAERFDAQVARHLDLSWQVTPFPKDLDTLLELAEQLPKAAPGETGALERVKSLIVYFTEVMPVEHRDKRYYQDRESRTKLNNLGIAYSLVVALNQWQHDASRSLRQFPGSGTAQGSWAGHFQNGGKDALTGRELMLCKPSVEQVKRLGSIHGMAWSRLFRHEDEIGAITLIKRLWHLTYLKTVWNLEAPKMPNTRQLALGESDADDDGNDGDDESGGYFAVLAFDGDSIGEWVSGARTPKFETQVSDYTPPDSDEQGTVGPKAYFEQLDGKTARSDSPRLLNLQRPVSPSYHLQLSEALSNFAIHCAPLIVKDFGGKLIYAGGDDVLAMLPAHKALACADALQRAFQGRDVRFDCGLVELGAGFLGKKGGTTSSGEIILPLVLPGPNATASVGIAIAHHKQPLQDVVRMAQATEKAAKRRMTIRKDGKEAKLKHALGVTLMKRSGETIEWFTRFDTEKGVSENDQHARGGYAAFEALLYALGKKFGETLARRTFAGKTLAGLRNPQLANRSEPLLSSKFPYRLSELLESYITPNPALRPHGTVAEEVDLHTARQLLGKELDHVLNRQRSGDPAQVEIKTLTVRNGREVNDVETFEDLERLREELLRYADNLVTLEAAAKHPSASTMFRQFNAMLATVAFIARQPDLN